VNHPEHVVRAEFDEQNVKPFGPATIEHRSAAAGLAQLGTYVMVFQESGLSDPWMVQYEESIYVVKGEGTIVSVNSGRETPLVASPGELVLLQKGATVRYGGTAGTELLLSIAPVNWRKLA
jgi:ethanolamine utilization protein EutQ (cupin superfamily)